MDLCSEALGQVGSCLGLGQLRAASSLPPPGVEENQDVCFVHVGNLIFFSFN